MRLVSSMATSRVNLNPFCIFMFKIVDLPGFQFIMCYQFECMPEIGYSLPEGL